MSVAGLAMLLGAVAFVGIAVYVWRRRTSPGAKGLVFLLLSGVEYSLVYALELSSGSLDAKLLWGDLKYLGICALPIAWLAFTLQFTGRGHRLTRPLIALLMVEPIVVLALLAYQPTHDLVRFIPESAALDRFPIVELGWVGWLHLVYTYVLLLLGSGLFVVTLGRLSRIYRRQVRALVAALVIPLVANTMYNFNIGPFGRIDLTPFAFTFTIVVLVWGIFRLHLLDIAPVARTVILETLDDGIIVLDAYQRIADLNPAAQRILECLASDAVGRPVHQLLPDHQHLLTHQRDATVRQEVRLRRSNAVHHYELTLSGLPDDRGRASGQLLVLRDISERKLAQERLERAAHYDALTGLPNRKLFGDRLAHAIVRAQRKGDSVALLFLDVDGFKVINDSHGHEVGDRLLEGIAHKLRSCLRAEDTVARLGGDEFTVILPEVPGPEAAGVVATKILETLRSPIVVAGHELYITASLGICVWPADGPDALSLLRNADVAMYRAKSQGKDRYEFYATDLSVRALQRLHLEEDLRRALDRGEFHVLYQPIVSLRSGDWVGVEALLRWDHPHRGILDPAEFLWLAEETGLIAPIGQWVLEEACAQARRWLDAAPGRPLTMWVNLSAKQLSEAALPDAVRDAVVAARLDPDLVGLEISESFVMDDATSALSSLRELKGLGVRVSLDDFGTGSTALGQLKRFPLDTLKIDRLFVNGLGLDPEDRAIVGAMIGLAHALGMTVVAEGVERPEQADALRELDCDLAQGFLFARPMPAASITAVVTAGSTLHSASA